MNDQFLFDVGNDVLEVAWFQLRWLIASPLIVLNKQDTYRLISIIITWAMDGTSAEGFYCCRMRYWGELKNGDKGSVV